MLAKEDLSARMTEWMGYASKTQSALARETGILQSCVHELMTGGTYPATETIQKMAQVAGDLTHPDGWPALFNDGGASMAYKTEELIRVMIQILNLLNKN